MRLLARNLIFACCTLLLCYFVATSVLGRRGSVQSPASSLFSPTQESSSSKEKSQHFHWAELPTRYPVKSLIHLPKEAPRRLPKVQYDFPAESASEASERKERQAAVKAAFARCWGAYEQRAWLADELAPLSGGSKNTFGGWSATLVDSLDTLWIMDMKTEFYKAVGALDKIDFTVSSESTINVFETTIRYLGGFLSAYDLSGDKSLLTKAVEMAEMLYVAFDTPNRMPITRWDFEAAMRGQAQVAPSWVLSAEVGSLTLEFTRLSQLTGDPRWFDAVQRITQVFDAQQNLTKLPGMWGIVVNAQKPDFTIDNSFSLGAMADSLYEYFPKMHALLGGNDPIYAKLYTNAAEAAATHLFFRPMTPDNADILVSGIYHPDNRPDQRLEPQGQHLVCFVGGMLALGSRVFGIPSHLEYAQKLVDGCAWAYKAFPSGMMPEVFYLLPCPSTTPADGCKWDQTAYHAAVKADNAAADPDKTIDPAALAAALRLQPGFTKIQDRRYILRPEAIESVFILYRVTGRKDLLDTAWHMFQSIQAATETPLANAALADMTVPAGERPPQMDSMESFWMAETLKYFYLIFSETGVVSLDEFVFNTEAHPLRRPV